MPTLVQGALQARLDRLPPRTREVVSVASAVGRGFGLPLLEQLLSHEQVVPALSDLMRLDLIVEVSRRPSPEYRFRHGLVQEVAYNSLLEPARRNLHRRIGEAIEALYGDAGESVYGPLARHFSEADEPERAARYSLLAGDAARSVYADHEALDHYRRARAFLRRLDDPARERETLFKIALVRHLAFDYSRAGQAYDAAFDCSAVERKERAPTPARLEIALVRPDSYAPGDTYSSDSAIVIEQLFRGLLRIDHDLNVVPELAQNMNVSADGLTYLFMLREDACWSDGHPLTAEDFVYAWRKLREEGHVTAFLLDDIESAEALDDWTLEVHLREPRNYFPYVLASHWSYPVAAPPRGRGRGGLAAARVARRQRAVRARRGGRDGRAADGESPLERGRGQRRRGADRVHQAQRGGAARRLARGSLRPPARARRAGRRSRYGRRALADALDDIPRVQRRPRADGRRAGPPCARPRDRQRGARGGLPGCRSRRRQRRRGAARHAGPRRGGGPRGTTSSGRASCSRRPAFPVARASPICASMRAPGRRPPRSPSSSPRSASARTSRPRGSGSPSPTDARVVPGWHADYPDPDGFYLGLFELDMPLYRDDETNSILARARVSRDRDERLKLYREFERIWIGQRAAIAPISYSRQLVLRRPNVHGLRLNPMGAFHLEQVVVDPLRER